MTKQGLIERYKETEAKKITDEITEVNLWKDEKRELDLHVRMLFAYGKLYYTGDMGTYVFGRDIHSITTFFKGEEINPEYWQEKVEAASRPVILEYADEEKVVSGLEKLAEARRYGRDFMTLGMKVRLTGSDGKVIYMRERKNESA